MRRQIETGRAATLEIFAPDGPPDLPEPAEEGEEEVATTTFELRGPEDEVLVAETAASVDSLDLEGTVQEGATTITFDSPEDLPSVGSRVWLSTLGDGRGYEAEVADVDAEAETIELVDGSRIDGDVAVKGVRLSVALSASQVGSTVRRRCRAIWRYKRNGQDRAIVAIVDIVRQPWNLHLTATAVDRIAAPFGLELGAWRGVLRQAEDDVFAHLASSGIEPDRVIERETLEAAAAWRAIALRYVHSAEIYDRAQAEVQTALGRFDKSSAWYSSSDTTNGGTTPERTTSTRQVRVANR